MNSLPEHLGGHANITHIDTNSLKYMKEKYLIKSAYDVGCGPGGMVEAMIKHGIKCDGIDGDYTIKRNCPIIIHDFSKGPINVEDRDFCWSVEFLEHVYEDFMDNYFSVFKKCKYVLCTASQNPNAYHHVNVKPISYWVEKFKERGFILLEDDTKWIRNNSNMTRNFVKETGMVFKRK